MQEKKTTTTTNKQTIKRAAADRVAAALWDEASNTQMNFGD